MWFYLAVSIRGILIYYLQRSTPLTECTPARPIQASCISLCVHSRKPTRATWCGSEKHSPKVSKTLSTFNLHAPISKYLELLYPPASPTPKKNSPVFSPFSIHIGTPAPDFPSGPGEYHHLGRLTPDHVMSSISLPAQRALGLRPFELRPSSQQTGEILNGEDHVLKKANAILGFWA